MPPALRDLESRGTPAGAKFGPACPNVWGRRADLLLPSPRVPRERCRETHPLGRV